MEIVHNAGKGVVSERTVDEPVSFLLSNRIGGFALFGLDSRYRGAFFSLESSLFKIIDDIRIVGEPRRLINNFWNFERIVGKVRERFFMPMRTNTLVYELSDSAPISVVLDAREPYDNRQWGRNYDISLEGKRVIVHFTKMHDHRDGDAGQGEEYSLYLVIKGDKNLACKKIEEWKRESYELDRKRNSHPFERYVYQAMELVAKKIVFSASRDRQQAIRQADQVFKSLAKLKVAQMGSESFSPNKFSDREIGFALACALNSLSSLHVEETNLESIHAGLPWFFQLWLRDEVVSLRAMMLKGQFELVKKILLRELESILPNGRLPNRLPANELASADAIGWHFKRWHDFIGLLMKKGLLAHYFDKKELIAITFRLKKAMDSLLANCTRDGLAINGAHETWMDSLAREGSCIEIQALQLCIYSLMFKLTADPADKKRLESLKEKVREKFWNGSCLCDAVGDPTIRPNVFVAAYLYPDLLKKEEWEKCFETVLSRLWLGFGGLSTVDKSSSFFCPHHTGENPSSYHNGDSWFWINNLAAIVLHRTSKEKFQTYIKSILDASTAEILWKGAVGSHAELSSAAELRSEGCLSQAWSNAMYIELVYELFQPGE
jgi:glycogen debranching enzyme